jgi:hypothetical protein
VKALEAIITETGVRVVEITHPDQGIAVVWCRRLGLDPYERVPQMMFVEGDDTAWVVERWRNYLP